MGQGKIAINGFGRIGRSVFRALYERLKNGSIDVVAINDLAKPEDLAYLLKHDTVLGRFPGNITHTKGSLVVNGKEIPVLSEKEPENLPWEELGIEVVIESSGKFTQADQARKHIEAGAKKVVISAPAKGEDITINIGVNDHQYDPDKHQIISNASCTTNCLSVMVKVLHEHFQIKDGFMTTVHSYTGSQKLVDSTHGKDKRRGRAAAQNIVPTTTGAAKSIGKVLPELDGKLDGYSIRVPTPDVSLLDLTLNVEKPTSREEVNRVLQESADNGLKNILGYSSEPLVSSDYIGDSRSCVIDSSLTHVLDEKTVKVVGWYDNEYGFSCRLGELAEMVAQKIPASTATS